jgi:hypothetical protein
MERITHGYRGTAEQCNKYMNDVHYTHCLTSPLPILTRIQVLWNVTLCHWVSGSNVSKELNVLLTVHHSISV